MHCETMMLLVTIRVLEESDRVVLRADHELRFSIEGPGELVAADNGDPTGMVSIKFKSNEAFNVVYFGDM